MEKVTTRTMSIIHFTSHDRVSLLSVVNLDHIKSASKSPLDACYPSFLEVVDITL